MKNHYIPCFYTKRLSENDQLTLYTRPHKDLVCRRKYPTQVGFASDIYTLPGILDETRFDLETKFFRDIDQKACNVMQKIDREPVEALSPQERWDWTTFLISLRQRNPQKLIEIGERARKAFDLQKEEYKSRFEEKKVAGDKRSFEEFVQELVDDRWFERTNLLLVQDAIQLPDSTKLLSSFIWSVFSLGAVEHDLLTCDRPVLSTDGIAKIGGHIILPLSPRRFFLAARTQHEHQVIAQTKDIAQIINDRIVRGAYKEVYGSLRLQFRFVERRLRAI